MVLIRQLPPNSRLWRAIDPDGTQWGELEQLVADLIDVTLAVNGSNKRWERPGQKAAVEAHRRDQGERFKNRAAARAKRRGEAAT